jgi:hypothetical protein
MKTGEGKLFHALLGETRSLRSTLAGLELGVGLADDVVGAFAAHDLAIGVAAFGGSKGRKYSHGWKSVGILSRQRGGGARKLGFHRIL